MFPQNVELTVLFFFFYEILYLRFQAVSSQSLATILYYSKPDLNLQKGPLTLLVLALTQITTLLVRNNVPLYCQLFWNQQFKQTVPTNDLNEVNIKEREFRTEGLFFSLITSFLFRYYTSSKKWYDSYTLSDIICW